MTLPTVARSSTAVRLCLWCLVAVLAEVALYTSYRGHDARFHWFTHFFVGTSVALLVMAAVAAHIRRPVPLPLVWLLLAHVVAMFPDFLFPAGIAHERWMDVFLGHISTHFIPGRNLTWFAVFLLSLAVYLAVVARCSDEGVSPRVVTADRASSGRRQGGPQERRHGAVDPTRRR